MNFDFVKKSKISWSLANEKNFMKWNKIGEVALVAAAVAGMVILDDFILAPLAAYIATVAPSLYQWIINSIHQMATCGG